MRRTTARRAESEEPVLARSGCLGRAQADPLLARDDSTSRYASPSSSPAASRTARRPRRRAMRASSRVIELPLDERVGSTLSTTVAMAATTGSGDVPGFRESREQHRLAHRTPTSAKREIGRERRGVAGRPRGAIAERSPEKRARRVEVAPVEARRAGRGEMARRRVARAGQAPGRRIELDAVAMRLLEVVADDLVALDESCVASQSAKRSCSSARVAFGSDS